MAGPLIVLGDALLDVDLIGRAERLAPDAPVPVLDDLREEVRPGGAALAAVLAAGAGHETVLVSALADDADGQRLSGLLEANGVRLVVVPRAGGTPVKRRVRAGDQSLLRLDTGEDGRIGALPREVGRLLADASAVLVADYGHGLVEEPDVRKALGAAATRVPLVWDPHPRGGTPVPAARLVTPNAAEAAALVPEADRSELTTLARRAARLVERWRAHAVVVTLGSRGALLCQGSSVPSMVPARPVRGADTCGAGDRFAAAAAVSLAGGSVTLEAVHDAVEAATGFVAAGGATGLGARSPRRACDADPVAQARATGGTIVATGGCFDLLHAGHVATLEAARALGDCLVVCLNSDASVRRLKGPSRPLVPAADRARVMAALAPVDAVIVFEEDTPAGLLRQIRPDVWVKGGDYAGADLPEASVLREWGGQAVVVPYLRGRSTTGLVCAAASARVGARSTS